MYSSWDQPRTLITSCYSKNTRRCQKPLVDYKNNLLVLKHANWRYIQTRNIWNCCWINIGKVPDLLSWSAFYSCSSHLRKLLNGKLIGEIYRYCQSIKAAYLKLTSWHNWFTVKLPREIGTQDYGSRERETIALCAGRGFHRGDRVSTPERGRASTWWYYPCQPQPMQLRRFHGATRALCVRSLLNTNSYTGDSIIFP